MSIMRTMKVVCTVCGGKKVDIQGKPCPTCKGEGTLIRRARPPRR